MDLTFSPLSSVSLFRFSSQILSIPMSKRNQEPRAAAPLQFEKRLKGLKTQRHHQNFNFEPHWETLEPTDERMLEKKDELEIKKKDKPELEKKEEPKPELERKDEPKPELERKEEPKPELKRKDEPKPELERKDEPKPELERKDEPKPELERKDKPDFKQLEPAIDLKLSKRVESRLEPKQRKRVESKFPEGGFGQEMEDVLFKRFPDFDVRSWLIFFYSNRYKIQVRIVDDLEFFDVHFSTGWCRFQITSCQTPEEMTEFLSTFDMRTKEKWYFLYAFSSCCGVEDEEGGNHCMGMYISQEEDFPRQFYFKNVDEHCLHMVPPKTDSFPSSTFPSCLNCGKNVKENFWWESELKKIQRRELRWF